jgi:anaerobic ribonucleoside-triphosphate reductase activating protein
MSLDELMEIIQEAQNDFGIEGVTFLGGEPSLQQNLPILTSRIKGLGLGVISFTGHDYEEVKECFVGCDVVLDGAYKQDQKEKQRRLLGSTNQRIICLTDRYADCIQEWFNNSETKTMEISLANNIIINGDAI